MRLRAMFEEGIELAVEIAHRGRVGECEVEHERAGRPRGTAMSWPWRASAGMVEVEESDWGA